MGKIFPKNATESEVSGKESVKKKWIKIRLRYVSN